MSASYGRCPCGGAYEARVVRVNMSPGAEAVSVPGLRQGACLTCGGRVYKAVLLEALEDLLRSGLVPSAYPAAPSETRASGWTL